MKNEMERESEGKKAWGNLKRVVKRMKNEEEKEEGEKKWEDKEKENREGKMKWKVTERKGKKKKVMEELKKGS